LSERCDHNVLIFGPDRCYDCYPVGPSDFGTNALIHELVVRGDLGLAARAYRRHRPLLWWKRRGGWPVGDGAS
jgi:hypothetical protein